MRILSGGDNFRWLEVCFGVLVVGILVGEVVLYSPPVQQATHHLGVVVQSVRTDAQSTSLEIAIAHGSTGQGLRLVAFPLSDRPVTRPSLFVYADPNYPTADAVQGTVDGIVDHLAGELLAHQYGSPVVAVTDSGLREVLAATSAASGRAVVMMSGVSPASVFSKGIDLLAPWVQAGGLVIWGGATIGYWSGIGGQPLTAGGRLSFGEMGTELLVGKGVVRYPWVDRRVGELQSDFAAALGITYQFASAGVLRDPALARGGLTLGWYSGPYSSLTYLPRGQGGYVLFGGEILDETSVSRDISRLFLTGALAAKGQVASKEIGPSGSPASSVIRWNLPFRVPNAGLMFIAFDPNPDGVFYYSRFIGQGAP